jgi:hypothetical protein
MTMNERIQTGKPYAWGFAAGLIVAPIIALSAGWVSTTGARDGAVETARVETLTDFCSAAAQKSWAAQNLDLAALKGYDNRVKRDELVAASMADIQVPEPLVNRVSSSCNKTLA